VALVLLALLAMSACTREQALVSPAAGPRSPGPGARAPATPQLVFAQAIALFEHGDDEPARERFARLLDSYPALVDYHLAYLAAIAERRGALDDAADYDDRLISGFSESVWLARALARRARVAAARGESDAMALVERALAAPGADASATAAAKLVQAELLAADAPRAAYERYQDVRRSGTASASTAREQALALERSHPELLSDPTLLLVEGTLLADEDRLDLAAERLAAAATTGERSERASALRTLARVREKQGRLDDAIATYREAADVEPAPGGTARFELATLLWNRDRDDEARELFRRMLDESPAHPKRDTARYALGRIAERAGDQVQATAEYRRLIATGRDPELVREARWRIAWSLYRAGDDTSAAEAFAAIARTRGSDEAAGLYWEARTRARGAATSAPAELYRALLARAPDSYYAELAERRLGESAPLPPPPEPLAGDPEALAIYDFHWTRARELHRAALDRAATREVDAIARDLATSGLEAPLLLEAYRELDAHERALRLATALERGGGLPSSVAVTYLYPRAYWTIVSDAAASERLDPHLLLALMRQESLFDPEAISPAAAHGLMQLLVRTATQVAGTPVSAAELAVPATNVRLGARYLRQLLDRYDGDVTKALAAYNAGEDAVAKWEARRPAIENDEFVEEISFRETRKYVKAVLGNYRRYRRLYGAPGEQRALPPSTDADGSDQAAAPVRPSVVRSFPGNPPKPPFDMSTSTSPGAASAATSAQIASGSAHVSAARPRAVRASMS